MLNSVVLAVILTQAAPQQLRWDPRVDLPVSGALAAGWLLSEFAFKQQLAPAACRWCETNTFDNSVRSAFNPGFTPSASGLRPAATASDVLGFGAAPLVALGLPALLAWRDGTFVQTFPVDAVLILEAMLVAQGLNQVVKFSVGRGRPYTVGAWPELLAESHSQADNNLSFYSGHTTFAFSLVSAAATIAELRGYRLAWLVWVVGLPVATATAVLRVAADKHWASDVALGAALGVASGMLLPRLLHGRVGPVTARLSPMANGVAVAGQF